MRVTEYKTVIHDDANVVILEKICSRNIAGISGQLDTSEKVYQLTKEFFNFNFLTEEYVFLLCLNCRMRLLSVFEISHGDIQQAFVSPLSIFQKALLSNATNIILIHNHPSSDVTPSKEDIITTKRIKEAGDLLKINLVDHLIVGFNNYLSLREHGCI